MKSDENVADGQTGHESNTFFLLSSKGFSSNNNDNSWVLLLECPFSYEPCARTFRTQDKNNQHQNTQ